VPALTGARWFLPLMAASGVIMSLTAPLEVLFAHDSWTDSVTIGVFMLTAAVGVILVDIFGTRFVPGLDAKAGLCTGLVMFGIACIGMGLAPGGVLLMASRVLQGLGSGVLLGSGLQAAVRITPPGGDLARALGRFNAAFLFGGAVGSPGGLLIAAFIEGSAGYRIAFVGTGVLALLVAIALAASLPRLSAPAGVPRPRLGLPRFARTPGSATALVLAMTGDFLRGGVLFTAVPLAGAARSYSIVTITVAIALMSGVEIAVLAFAHHVIRRSGVTVLLIGSFALGVGCALTLALNASATTYIVVSAIFGVCLAGATATLPVLVVGQVGDSSAGLAKFRISAGVGILIGSVGCAILATELGIARLFSLIAVVLLGSAVLARLVGRRVIAT